MLNSGAGSTDSMRLLPFLFLLLLVTPALGEPTYSVRGLPIDYALGAVYEVSLTVSDPGAVTGVAITTTNGSLSAANEFAEGASEAHELRLGPADRSFWWLAPVDPQPLGEGEAEFNITFEGEDNSTWATYEVVVRPPPIVADDEAATPEGALQLAWGGAAATALLTLAAAFVLRRG